ncbi:MAG TPA: GNAT family N-acetyltransferase [Xanthomonadales bacterium]|nr:GNAT family N-acetyltransferase [Xanthomonadales bacterium]
MNNSADQIIIEQLTSLSLKDAEAIRRLVSQLGSEFQPLGDKDLKEMLKSPTTYLLVARQSKTQKIVGMATLAVYRIPYAKKAYFDDFIIEEAYQGQGIGSLLLEKVLAKAAELGATYIDFTSTPTRLAANKLYEKFGFTKRDTNVYRLTF